MSLKCLSPAIHVMHVERAWMGVTQPMDCLAGNVEEMDIAKCVLRDLNFVKMSNLSYLYV